MLKSSECKKPKVSIIIPVYNGHNFLGNAIECALKQTYSNIEIIVVNDGSIDEGKTEKIAKSYGDKIRYYYKENGGVSSALNYGISKMEGEYFSWLSHDDGYSKDKVKDSIELLNKYNQIGKKTIAFTGGNFIDSNGKEIYSFKKYFEAYRIYSGSQVADIMSRKGTLNGCCMLIPKEAFKEVGVFDETLRYSQDSLMWYNFFLKGYRLISDNKANVMYRLHGNQASQTRRDLYEHDALYIAKILAQPLSQLDTQVFTNYVKRCTKNQCNDAIDYLVKYANQHKIFSVKQKISIQLARVIGTVRYRLIKIYKKLLLQIRKK